MIDDETEGQIADGHLAPACMCCSLRRTAIVLVKPRAQLPPAQGIIFGAEPVTSGVEHGDDTGRLVLQMGHNKQQSQKTENAVVKGRPTVA